MSHIIKAARIYVCMLVQFGAHCCVTDTGLASVVFDIDFRYRSERIERNGSLEYGVFVDVKWNVTGDQGIDFRGIIYHLGGNGFSQQSISKRAISLSGGNNQMLPPGNFPPHNDGGGSDCDAHRNETIWTADENGTAIQCRIPCEGIILDEMCSVGANICGLLSSGFKTASKDTRNITVPVRFGAKYRLELYVYRGWSYGSRQRIDYVDGALFCRHELVTKFNLTKEYADDYCGEQHEMDPTWYTSGPVRNLRVASKRVDFHTNQHEAVLEWQEPLDVYKLSSITEYSIAAKNGRLVGGDNGWYVPNEIRNGYIRATFQGITRGMKTRIQITPRTYSPSCTDCTEHGRSQILNIANPDVGVCGLLDQTPFCVEHADCEEVAPDARPAAVCTCHLGYVGNGVDPEYGGTGCEERHACSNTTIVKEVCAEHAFCEDLPAPSLDFNCSCPDGYIGDGYLSGTGCEYDSSIEQVIIAVVCVVAFVIILAILLTMYCRKKRRESKLKQLAQYQVSLFNIIKNSNSDSEAGLFGDKWELNRNQVELKGIIGRGNFGVVQRAILRTEDGEQLVAVKMTTDAATEDYKRSFKHEILLLSEIDSHENLLSLLGCCTDAGRPMLMVTQFMKYGDLLHFLWKAREASSRESDPIYMLNEMNVYQIAEQVARGMLHLKKMRIIHGDLAARNVLVGEGLSCKISDFGLANNVYEEGVLRDVVEKTIPVRWVSPERMMGGRVPIDWRSDVWSYGVLLYETVTLGSTPYPDIESAEIFDKLKSGYRMPKPDFCTQYLYEAMRQCWEMRPSKRPSFALLEKKMKGSKPGNTATYVNLHAVVPDLECNDEVNTEGPHSREIADGLPQQSLIYESEKVV